MANKSAVTASSKKGTEFLCKIRYKNTLPELPFGPKLLDYPLDEEKFTQFQFSDWLKRTEYPTLTEYDLGYPINLVDYTFRKDEWINNSPLKEEDAALLETPLADGESGQTAAAAQPKERHRPIVPWLRRTEYISSEGSRMVAKKQESVEQRRVQRRLDKQQDLLFDNSIESQLRMIENTFSTADLGKLSDFQLLRHPGKPDLKAVEVFPVLPDFSDWTDMFVHCYFDDDPAVRPMNKLRSQLTVDETAERELIDRQLEQEAVLKPMVDPSRNNEQFMVYFLPSTTTTTDTSSTTVNSGNDMVRLDAVRHYNFRLEKEPTMEKIFFTFHPGSGAFYNQVQGRVNLKKRRLKAAHNHGSGAGNNNNSNGYHRNGRAVVDSETPTALQLKRIRRAAEQESEREQAIQQELLQLRSSVAAEDD